MDNIQDKLTIIRDTGSTLSTEKKEVWKTTKYDYKAANAFPASETRRDSRLTPSALHSHIRIG